MLPCRTGPPEEEDEAVASGYHNTMLSGKHRQVVRQTTDKEGGRFLLPDNLCTNTRQPVAEVLQKKHPDTRVPPWKFPCAHPSKNTRKYPKLYPLIPRRMK